MDSPSLYDEDIYAWAEQQAATLRRLASRRDLPNELDLENVAEEIESVGRSELRVAESAARLIFVHLIKCRALPQSPSMPHWRTEVITWRGDLRDSLTRSIRSRLDLERVWQRAIREAVAALEEHGCDKHQAATWRAALACMAAPLSLDDLCSETADFEQLVLRVYRDD